jgi:ketol-acid reductoisomerase
MEAYYDRDADLEILRNKTLGIIGYGNQGRAQALNWRDSGLNVLVGVLRDSSATQAEADGFRVAPIAEAAAQADVLSLLVPDEVQRQLYDEVLASRLGPGKTLNFAHGYNIHYGLILPPAGVDVIMVAPRMIGTMVREAYTRGGGAPAFVAVAQDASGHAFQTALALARGIGATRAGVLRTTFSQETELDLFQEQGLWPLLVRTMTMAFEFLVGQGFPQEMVALEMYGSEEAAEIFREMARVGFFKQMRFHSQTSQYGTLSRAKQVPFAREMQSFMERALDGIRNGQFAAEWRSEQESGYEVFSRLRAEADAHALNQAEAAVRQLLGWAPGQIGGPETATGPSGTEPA